MPADPMPDERLTEIRSWVEAGAGLDATEAAALLAEVDWLTAELRKVPDRIRAAVAGPSDVPPESGGHCPDGLTECRHDCDPAEGQCARVLRVLYRNWRGEVAERRFMPQGEPYEGASQWHPEVQPLMDVIDADNGERRTIALRGVERWGSAPVDPLAHVHVGDPVPEPDVEDTCDELGVIADEGLTVTCTRQAGHPGQHIACGDEVLAVWPATPDADPRSINAAEHRQATRGPAAVRVTRGWSLTSLGEQMDAPPTTPDAVTVHSGLSGGALPAETPPDAVTHQCPPDGAVLLPCCNRTPFEVPETDRITADAALVTCSVPDAVTTEGANT